MDLEATVDRMLASCVRDGQSVERIPSDRDADAVRARLRSLAKERGLRIRTARLGDAVAVVRLDAAIWHEDAATMRRKLSPAD